MDFASVVPKSSHVGLLALLLWVGGQKGLWEQRDFLVAAVVVAAECMMVWEQGQGF